MKARVVLREGFHFSGVIEGGAAVEFDAPPRGQAGRGPSPMEAVLMAAATCSAMDVVDILRKARQEPDGLEVRAEGHRAEDHPRVFTSIALEYIVRGSVKPEALARAIDLSLGKYCSVGVMLARAGVRITATHRVEA